MILPLTVLRRLDCVLAPTKDCVLRCRDELKGRGLQDLDAQLRKASGFAFCNTSRYDFDKRRADAPQLAANLRNYIAGFSQNMREVLERFDFDNTIGKLDARDQPRREEGRCHRQQGLPHDARRLSQDPRTSGRTGRPRS